MHVGPGLVGASPIGRGSWITNGDFFLSYRRADSRGDTGRLYDRLVAEFGAAHVFRDVDAIAPGEPFADVLRDRLDRCDALLAVIGPGWLAAESEGRRRLDDATDFVRLEIATALERGIPVIPVLVGGAAVPTPDLLPDPLAPLASYQAAVLDELHFHADVDLLVDRLRARAGVQGRRRTSRPRQVGGDHPWRCRDPDWYTVQPGPWWPALSIDWPASALALVRRADDGAVAPALATRIDEVLARLWRMFGIIVPGVCMRRATGSEYVVRVAGAVVGRGALGDDPLASPLRDLEAAIRDDPTVVVGHQEVASLLTAQDPDVLDAILSTPGALSELVMVCHGLLAEHVPISELSVIVSVFRALQPAGASLVDVVEEIRMSAGVRKRLPGNDSRHACLTLSPAVERAFVAALDLSATQPVLAMPATTVQEILAAVDDAVADLSGAVAIVVRNPSIRPFVRALLDLGYPRLWVLSRRELTGELEQRTIGQIELR